MLMMWWARWSIWIVGCALATAVVLGNAFYQKKQFYPTVVYITKSKPSMAVMYAQALLFVVMLGKLFRKLFFGQLRAAEFEHLVERSWYAVTETCLAFTVFRDDFSPKFLALFTLLLFLKSFHWLAEERVDYMERSPVITWVFHIRVLSLMAILLMLDLYFVNVAYQSTLKKGASVQLVFGFEYAILTTIVLNTVAKYVFHVVDMQNETPWENKAVFVLHAEVVIGFFKVVLYVVFVVIMVRIYTLPLFALRPTYLALRAFKKALNDVIMSRRAINNMNNLYPDVTQEELANTDNVCIICREEMTGGAKKLPCNHIFHVSCLRSWFQRQQTCPTCRLNVLRVPAPAAAGLAGVAAGANLFNLAFPGFGGQGGVAPQPVFRAPPQQQQGQGQQLPPGFGMWNGIPPAWFQGQQPIVPGAGPQPGADGQAQPGAQQNAAAAGGEGQAPPGPDAAGGAAAGPGAAAFRPNNYPYMFGQGVPGPPPFMFRPPTATGAAPYPFSVPPMPYIPMVPPPPPLLQTTGLSEEDLRRMEGTARDNIEARLRCLRNVQILLDSAVVQMQQYSAVVATLNTAAPTPTPTTTTGPTQASTSSSSGNTGATANNATPSTSTAQQASVPLVKEIPSMSVNNGVGVAGASSPATEASSVVPPTPPTSEQDELRKRRLQRFTTTNNPTTEPPAAGGGGGGE